MNRYLLAILILYLFGCQEKDTGGADVSAAFELTMIPVPTQESGAPNLFIGESGKPLLSWVEYLNDTTDALYFARLEADRWSAAMPIAQGSDWFVNWADFPSMASYEDHPEQLAVHWLQKSAAGVYDYDVRIAQSMDKGQSWSASFVPHTDGVAAEHGFVTLMPADSGRIFAVWLDGRNTKAGGGHGEHAGAMTLRTAEFDATGQLYAAAELDGRVCDCCQTDAARTANGPIVVYRDRSTEEIRDIAVIRKVNGAWTAPQKIYADNWEIAGCPVNGPAIAAQGQSVAIAWFSAAVEEQQVKLVLSTDGGATFSEPIRIDDGHPLGRVDVVLANEDQVVVSWLEETEQQGAIRLAKVNQQGAVLEKVTVANTDTSRESGFPILARWQDRYLLAWTQVDSVTTVQTALINF